MLLFTSKFKETANKSLNKQDELIQIFMKLEIEEKQKKELANNILERILFKPSNSLSYYDNPIFRKQIAYSIASEIQILSKDKKDKAIETIYRLYNREDFMWIGEYLRCLKSDEKYLQDYLTRIPPDIFSASIHNAKQAPYCNKTTEKTPIFLVNKLEDIFKNEKQMLGYVPDNFSRDLFKELQSYTGGSLVDYIEQSFDLPGMYSLVRRGLVKKIPFKNGFIIAKQNNPEKEGRFLNEQKNIIKLKKILGLENQDKAFLLKSEKDRNIYLKLLSPFAVISLPKSVKFYSLTLLQPGKTFEEVLIYTTDIKERERYLKEARLILHHLYQKGIIWGDMAPRNILVEETGNSVFYTILDFEKTTILERPINDQEKEEHSRGPMCIEEFGAICSEQEVLKTFLPYFDPSNWEITSHAKLPFKKPKREVISILESRGIKDINLGEYNKLEKEIMEIRFPQVIGEKTKYPLSISFRIDHYLGNIHDLKTTEIFISAKSYKLLIPVIERLEELIQIVENKFLLIDFYRLTQAYDIKNHKDLIELRMLSNAINLLYDARIFPEHLKNALEKIDYEVNSYYISINPEYGINGKTIHEDIYNLIHKKIKTLLENSKIDLIGTVFVSGGFSKKQMAFGSDIDIGFNNINTALQTKIIGIIEETGLEVELYKTGEFENLENHPELFLDAKNIKPLLSKNDDLFLKKIHDKFEKLKSDRDYIQLVIKLHWDEVKNNSVFGIFPSIRLVKNLRNFSEILYTLNYINNDLYNLIDPYLLFVKSQLRVENKLENETHKEMLSLILSYVENIYLDRILQTNQDFLKELGFQKLSRVNSGCLAEKAAPLRYSRL